MYVELLERMKAIIGDEVMDETGASDELLSYYLDIAADRIIKRRYPWDSTRPANASVGPYKYLQLEIAIFLFNKRGAEMETLHSENGISRSYGTESDIPEHLIGQVTPKGRVR